MFFLKKISSLLHRFKKTILFQGFFLFSPYIFQYNHCVRYLFSLLIVGCDLWVAAQIPLITKNIVDTLRISTAYASIIPLLGMLTVFWIIDKISHYVQDLIFFPVINQAIKDITERTVKTLHRLPFTDFQRFSIPQVASALKRVSQSARSFIKVTFLHIVPVVGKIFIALYMLSAVQFLAPSFLLLLTVWGIVYFYGTRWYLQQRQKAWQLSDNVMQEIISSLTNTLLVRYTHDSPSFQQVLTQEANAWLNTNKKNQWVLIILGLLMGISYGAGLYLSMNMFMAHRLTLGEFVMVKGILLGIFVPLRTLSFEIRQISESLIDIKTVKEILYFPLISDSFITKECTPINKGIFLKDITYRYFPKTPLIENMNLQIEKGQKILLQGPNGSGKSTLCHLMAGLYLPQKGNVWINQTNTKEFFPSDISSNDLPLKNSRLYFIPQKFMIFDQSFLYNLTYGCTNIGQKEQEKVLELTQLQSFSKEILGHKGIQLSEGEKQRLALARALLLTPEILILDESTAFIDPVSEKAILEAIFEQIETVIIVAHHFSYLEKLDAIYDIRSLNHK